MARLSTKLLTPGMTLERPVVNKNGLMMIAEDTELTAALIEKIQTMGVETVHVHGAAKARPPMEDELARLDRRFGDVGETGQMAVLKRLLKEHIESLYETNGP